MDNSTVNDTTNNLTTKIIFKGDIAPQNQFCYRDLSEQVKELTPYVKSFLKKSCPDMMKTTHGPDKSLLPYFPGYKFEGGKSIYKGEEVGEGGYVYAEPGMHFKSDEASLPVDAKEEDIIFYDIEVFPNLFLVNWKLKGEKNKVVRMINPTPEEIEELLKYRLVGFNCRRYDNHILYARLMGYSNEQLYNLSQRIINGERNAFFGEAYNLSYTDIYDFASAGNKKSLKKLEIEMGIHHKELGLPWDEPVPEEKWI